MATSDFYKRVFVRIRQVELCRLSARLLLCLTTDGIWPVWASLVLKKEILVEQ